MNEQVAIAGRRPAGKVFAVQCCFFMLEGAGTKGESSRFEIVLDRDWNCRYFEVTSVVRPSRRVLTEREEQTMGHDNLAMNDARQSMMVSWDAIITRP